MNKKIAILISLILFLLFVPHMHRLEAIVSVRPVFDVTDLTCGVADSENNKCCTFPPTLETKVNVGGLLGRFVGLLITPIQKFMEIKKLQGNQLVDKYIEFGDNFRCPGSPEPVYDDPNDKNFEDPDDTDDNACVCQLPSSFHAMATDEDAADAVCGFVGSDDPKDKRAFQERASCRECVMGTGRAKGRGVWTGMGCLYTEFGLFIQETVFGTLVGLAGIVALLCIIYSAIKLQTSRANPEEIQKARERLTSCLLGLLLIIFSIFILRVIGIDLLRIPGFGG